MKFKFQIRIKVMLLSILISVSLLFIIDKYCPINIDPINFTVLGLILVFLIFLYGYFYDGHKVTSTIRFIARQILVIIFATDCAFINFKYNTNVEYNMFALLFSSIPIFFLIGTGIIYKRKT